jgi:hypothetical protein
VICTQLKEIRWFDLQNNAKYQADAAGIIKSTMFPGLWLSTAAIFDDSNYKPAIKVLNQGLQSIEHAEFAKTLRPR